MTIILLKRRLKPREAVKVAAKAIVEVAAKAAKEMMAKLAALLHMTMNID